MRRYASPYATDDVCSSVGSRLRRNAITTTGVSIAEEIDRMIEERSLLKHPFYQAWQRGELTLEALKNYAGQYYHHVLAFPQYVSAAHSSCPDQSDRQEVLENLIEEERGEENHPELWLRFGEARSRTDEDK